MLGWWSLCGIARARKGYPSHPNLGCRFEFGAWKHFLQSVLPKKRSGQLILAKRSWCYELHELICEDEHCGGL